MNMIKMSLLAALATPLVGAVALHADTTDIVVTNPDFADGLTGYNYGFSFGNGGAYSASNPTVAGSTGFDYSVSGNQTGLSGAPAGDSTAGFIGIDTGDVMGTPSSFTSNTNNVNINSTGADTVRMASTDGDLVYFTQDTGVKFAADTVYVLTAYASGVGSGPNGFANTGVGLSGTSGLTATQVESDPDLVGLGKSNGNTLQLETVTIDTKLPAYASLIGQDIVVNLLDQSSVTGGGRGGYFTDVTLTATIPEPSTYLLMLGGLGLLIVVARRRFSSAV